MAENERVTSLLTGSGFTPEVMRAIDHLVVGCGGFVKELISFTAGSSSLKGESGQRLSAADELVDQLLRERLAGLVPGSGGYSEEGGEFGPAGARVRWLIDPVDGTRPAVLGGAFAVCAGAVIYEDGRPAAALGWVYVPTLTALYRGMISESGCECLRNGRPVTAPPVPEDELAKRYLAVGSDWHRAPMDVPLKLSAPGATAVHLSQLVHAGSDVAAVALSRYHSYDAAAGLAVACAGGCEIRTVTESGWSEPRSPLDFLGELDRAPAAWGPRALVGHPGVLQLLVRR